jgi:hypothetical protein
MGQPPKYVDARQQCAKKRNLPGKESNERGPGFNVAAVTIEISALSIRFDCNRRLLCALDRASKASLFQLKD